MSVLVAFWRLHDDSAFLWGGLGLAGVVFAALASLDPVGLSRIDGPWLAVGFVMLAAAFELAAAKLGQVLRMMSPPAAGVAWLALSVGLNWDSSEFVFSTSLVFGALALTIGVLARFGKLHRPATVWWGTLAAVAVTSAALMTIDPNIDPQWGPAVTLGLVMLAAGFELAAPTVDESLRYLSVAATGAAWITLGAALNWDQTQAVALTTVIFGILTVRAHRGSALEAAANRREPGRSLAVPDFAGLGRIRGRRNPDSRGRGCRQRPVSTDDLGGGRRRSADPGGGAWCRGARHYVVARGIRGCRTRRGDPACHRARRG